MKVKQSKSQINQEQTVEVINIDNENGLEITMISLGATIISVKQADKTGKKDEITLGFDTPAEYHEKRKFFGASIGRFGNRIANGRFSLNGREYFLATNNGVNHLHGGISGFDRKIWKTMVTEKEEQVEVLFTYTSPDGEEGYPGTLKTEIKHTLTKDGRLKFEYKAETDEETIINLTNHTFWNLAGAGSGPIANQIFQSSADRYLPVDQGLIPTGEERSVEGTPFDFRKEKAFRKGFEEVENSAEFKNAPDPVTGYDHCFLLPEGTAGEMCWAGTFADTESGRRMEVFTNQPAFQLYTCGKMEETPIGGGKTAGPFGAFCIETENYPDSPNQPQFPSSVLKPGETYIHQTIHRFSVI